MSKEKNYENHAPAGMFFFLTYFGALWYFLQISYGFWPTILAFFKALVWPVYLIHRVFELLRI